MKKESSSYLFSYNKASKYLFIILALNAVASVIAQAHNSNVLYLNVNDRVFEKNHNFKNTALPQTLDQFHKESSKLGFFKQVGKASWYGPGFHGKRTASGEKFNMYAWTAAHPFLPLSSYVSVTNRANNKTVMVKITDRGPLIGKRIIDLSYGAAKALNIRGVQSVIIKKVSREKALKWIQQKSMKTVLKNNDPHQFSKLL